MSAEFASGERSVPVDPRFKRPVGVFSPSLRDIGRWLLEEHANTVDSDRLAAIYNELTAALLRGATGTVVELGCFKGAMALWMRAILDDCGRPDVDIEVFDSFEGLPEPDPIDGTHLKKGDVRASPADVAESHDRWKLRRPTIHAGWFDVSLGEMPDRVAFCYLDVDFFESTRLGLEAVCPRLSASGTLVLDDYADLERNPRAWPMMAGVKAAADEYFAGSGETVDVLEGEGDLAFGVWRRQAAL